MAMPPRNVTSLLLAAMLLGATVAPPAVRHSHPVEEGGAGRYHHHEDHPAHEHGGQHADDARESITSPGSSCSHWWHMHFQVLGVNFTLPEPSSSRSDRESEADSEVLVLVTGQEFFSGSSSRPDSLERRLPTPAFSVVGNAAALQTVVSAPPPVSCAPLCDSARQERSGVLLA